MLDTEIDEQDVSDQVRNFRREPGEDIMSFINRADILVKICNAEQAKEIRSCIYYRFGGLSSKRASPLFRQHAAVGVERGQHSRSPQFIMHSQDSQ